MCVWGGGGKEGGGGAGDGILQENELHLKKEAPDEELRENSSAGRPPVHVMRYDRSCIEGALNS